MDRALIARFRSAPELGLHFLLGSLIVVALPRLLPNPLSAEAARTGAALAIAVTVAIYAAEVAIVRSWWWTGIGPYVGVTAAAGFALYAPDERAMLTIPAAGLLGAGVTFTVSLVRRPSIIERAAFWMQPKAPDFIRPYCWNTTAIWALLFVAFGFGIGWTTWFDSPNTGRRVVGWVPVTVGAFSLVEFLVRKWWFRHYEDKWIDRVLAKIFPWQSTELGRRSHTHIQSVIAANDSNVPEPDTAVSDTNEQETERP